LPRKSESYVTRSECAKVSGQIRNEILVVKKALVGEDMRGGIVKEIRDIKSDIEAVKKYVNDEKAKGRDWRMLGFAILGSVISGLIITVVTFLL